MTTFETAKISEIKFKTEDSRITCIKQGDNLIDIAENIRIF